MDFISLPYFLAFYVVGQSTMTGSTLNRNDVALQAFMLQLNVLPRRGLASLSEIKFKVLRKKP